MKQLEIVPVADKVQHVLAQYLREKRLAAKMTQAELREACGWRVVAVEGLRAFDPRAWPSSGRSHLRATINWVMGGWDEQSARESAEYRHLLGVTKRELANVILGTDREGKP